MAEDSFERIAIDLGTSSPGREHAYAPALPIHPLSREEERRIWLENFEKNWKSVRELRPNHKLAIKQYYSLNQGHDGGVALCYYCKAQFGIKALQIHHLDHDRRNNQLSNIVPACEPCNEDEKSRWMSEYNRRAYVERVSLPLPKEKENEIGATKKQEIDQQRLVKQAPLTTQLKLKYRHEVLKLLIKEVMGHNHRNNRKNFDELIADTVFLVGCSQAKAIEYVDSFTISVFAPFRQWTDQSGTWIGVREGWNETYATDEYKKALSELGLDLNPNQLTS